MLPSHVEEALAGGFHITYKGITRLGTLALRLCRPKVARSLYYYRGFRCIRLLGYTIG